MCHAATHLIQIARLKVLRRRSGRDATGAAAVEYALLVSFIAAVIIVTVGVFGTSVLGLFETARLALGG